MFTSIPSLGSVRQCPLPAFIQPSFQTHVEVLLGVVDDALLHKRGKHVYGLGWFRDAVASTAKRVATAGGNQWVVVGLAICSPGTTKMFGAHFHKEKDGDR
jgi:hypothetical protein